MRLDRRRVLASLFLFLSAGCLGEESLAIPFDLRIQNRDSRPRQLSVVVDHVTEGAVYDETRQLAAGEALTEEAVAEVPGRYRIRANDITTDAERTAEQNVELTTGVGFCGWFVVRAESESVIATVPRCPDTESTNNT
ncbi:hypothetical protein halTADL_1720 [Halohasta litchfieldiae]|jgi:hypothetical protein|uniref:Uncharacterized protein n=1 Tax=Halohasta litchfieldiae TaxID=1073996 RepID=A0A1H6R287_9EURY|nr:hypothetical protein [Halohasta litchfieldiae]ATW88474.1 hypothetical protein halTADL_1720 [Halohasta litchfieldiae]SEI50048.1 hypothetical protein SAMN05444271_101245 [Halohasta litchfieldiae]